MDYLRFDPTGCGFPKPRVPVLPTLSRQSLVGRQPPCNFRPLGSGSDATFFSRGRYALSAAYGQAGVGSNGALLAPAYHCRTMLDPAIELGAEIALYRLKPDLSPDMQSLAECLSSCKHPVKALLVTHYFGFAQALEPLAEFCAAHAISLIEDCSHALFVEGVSSSATNSGMGQTGRFGVASPYKFFSCEDGGLLWSNDTDAMPNHPRTVPTWTQELKGFVRSIQRAQAQRQALDTHLIDLEIKAYAATPHRIGRDRREADKNPSKDYLATETRRQSLTWSRWVMRYTNVNRLVEQRRQNYQQWADAIAALPHCKAFFPRLPADCVPYMFPLLIEQPEIHFSALKHLGVPIWRWDDMAISNCPAASNYRLRLLHLPCHQELSEQQMIWMTSAVSKVMQKSSPGARL